MRLDITYVHIWETAKVFETIADILRFEHQILKVVHIENGPNMLNQQIFSCATDALQMNANHLNQWKGYNFACEKIPFWSCDSFCSTT